MKKATILLIMAAGIFACSRKTVVATDTKTNRETAGTEAKAADANAALLAKGQTVYTTSCGKCHDLKSVDAYTTQQWTHILKDMIPRSKLDNAQATQVTAYVMANAKKS